jgi:FAD/FMN-containing dehydrogenase
MIQGANNIDGGILMVMSNLTSISVSSDRKTVDISPGLKWGAVYKHLEQFDLTVGGGRLSPVGVPGLLLGGGINFYGNQYGFSADQVVGYEIVLASGLIVDVSASKYPDLFWALKGGSSNYGIVTRFTMATIPSKKVLAGVYTIAGEHSEAALAVSCNTPLSRHYARRV